MYQVSFLVGLNFATRSIQYSEIFECISCMEKWQFIDYQQISNIKLKYWSIEIGRGEGPMAHRSEPTCLAIQSVPHIWDVCGNAVAGQYCKGDQWERSRSNTIGRSSKSSQGWVGNGS